MPPGGGGRVSGDVAQDSGHLPGPPRRRLLACFPASYQDVQSPLPEGTLPYLPQAPAL